MGSEHDGGWALEIFAGGCSVCCCSDVPRGLRLGLSGGEEPNLGQENERVAWTGMFRRDGSMFVPALPAGNETAMFFVTGDDTVPEYR